MIGIKLGMNLGSNVPTLLQQALSAIRRNGGTALYVPDDYRGAFVDSTGTQPVTAINDLVGLLTDRSYGAGNLGAELVTNGDFSAGTTGWSKVFAGSISVSSGVLRVTNNDGTGSDQEKAFTVVSTVAGRTYALSTQLITLSGGPGSILVRDGSNSESGSVIVSDSSLSVGNKRFVFVAQSSSTTVQVRLSANFANGYSEWDNISVREVLGNHASQPTTASKPLVTQLANGTKALDFDGSNDRLLLSAPQPTTALTFIFAANFVGTATQVLTNSGLNGAGLYRGGGIMTFDKSGAGLALAAAFPDGPAVVSVVSAPGNRRMYRNGTLIASDTTTVSFSSAGPYNIGTSDSGGSPFAEWISDIAIFNTAIPDADRRTIERNMANRAGVAYAG